MFRRIREIEAYDRLTMGVRFRQPTGDMRSLDTHFHAVPGIRDLHTQIVDWLIPLSNRVAHHGYLATRDEGRQAVALARDLLKRMT